MLAELVSGVALLHGLQGAAFAICPRMAFALLPFLVSLPLVRHQIKLKPYLYELTSTLITSLTVLSLNTAILRVRVSTYRFGVDGGIQLYINRIVSEV